jgi:hypothetical protein
VNRVTLNNSDQKLFGPFVNIIMGHRRLDLGRLDGLLGVALNLETRMADHRLAAIES